MARKTTRMHVTIHDVARRANVTVGTVSKALNRNGSLRQETRDKIINTRRGLAQLCIKRWARNCGPCLRPTDTNLLPLEMDRKVETPDA